MNPAHQFETRMWVRREELLLAPYAMFSNQSQGRRYPESNHPYRSPFQRDRDRILHSAAFRRLSGKMQVFTGEMGDYHRTRLTHTHEVTMIARTIGRVLKLNEDLIEALALLHDIGHPPYGHSGEDVLDVCLREFGGFSHNRFALTLVEELEHRFTPYAGLNLTKEVLAGQDFRITHDGHTPLLEVQVVDLADSIAYNAHDVDDALKLGLIQLQQLSGLGLVQRADRMSASQPLAANDRAARQALAHSLIDVQVADLLDHATDVLADLGQLDSLSVRQLGIQLDFTPLICDERAELKQFLFDNVYRHPKLVNIRQQASTRLTVLFNHLVKQPAGLPVRFQDRAQRVGVERAVGDYIAGMTDRFCDQQYRQIVELGDRQAVDW